MSSGAQLQAMTMPNPLMSQPSEQWYALLTRSRHEKVVADRLRERGFETFLPLVRQVRQWSDRKKVVEQPLFSGYVFVRLAPMNEQRVRVLDVDGVAQFVGVRGEGTPIPEEQIGAVRLLLEQDLSCALHPFLKVGQRVRIRGGALDGMEGILVSRKGERALVVSVDAIERSLAVSVEGYGVEAV